MVNLAVDVGGTNARVTAYDNVADTDSLETIRFKVTQHRPEAPGDFEKDFRELQRACRELQSKHGPIDGIGLAVAGKLDKDRLTLEAAGNLGHWVGKPIVSRLSTELRTSVLMEGDGKTAGLAEAFYGRGRELKGASFIEMIWGTGVGGCIVYQQDDKLFTVATELGHVCVVQNGKLCGCGQHGCLEAYVGGNGILKHRGKPAEDLSREEWLEIARRMVQGIRSILAVQPVKYLIFTGGLICKQDWLLPLMEEQLKHPMQGSPKLLLSALGESAGTLGALSLLRLARQN